MLKKPIIGIVGRLQENGRAQVFINEEYRLAIVKSGGIPILLLPPYQDQFEAHTPFIWDNLKDELQDLTNILDLCDGFLFTGGEKWFGYEEFIMEYAYQKDKPVLGICLGMQMIACMPFFHNEDSNYLIKIGNEKHYQGNGLSHTVTLFPSKLKDIIKKDEMFVTSRHYDTIAPLSFFRISALSKDGIIEAIELPKKHFFIGVQWHPESSFFEDENSRIIYQAFVEACLTYMK